MGYFPPGHPPAGAGGADADEQAESLRRIEAGSIPVGAERRLAALGADGSLFTSGLSVAEFALLGEVGPRPLAQVLGASVVNVGYQYLPALPPRRLPVSGPYDPPYGEPSPAQTSRFKWHQTIVCELDTITQAWTDARRLALGRLSEEALAVGADAVVGVHLQRGEHDWSRRTIDYLVSGTAVRSPDSTRTRFPVLSDLSVQDYWRLHQAGLEPAGMLAASSVVFVSASRTIRMRRARTLQQGQELEELSRGFHLARDSVREALRSQTYGCRGSGAVGVEFAHTVHRDEFSLLSSVPQVQSAGWHRGRLGIPYHVSAGGDTERSGWAITMHGAGTAVRRRWNVPQYPPETALRLGPR